MPQDLKTRLDQGHMFFTAKDLEGQTIPPDYEIVPLNGGDPLTYSPSGMFRIVKKEDLKREQNRDLGVVGGGLAAMGGAALGGGGLIASTIAGLGGASKGAVDNSAAGGIGDAISNPLLSLGVNAASNLLPGGGTIPTLLRAGLQAGAAGGQNSISNWIANKLDKGERSTSPTLWDLGAGALAGAAQTARGLVPESYLTKSYAQMTKLLDDAGIKIPFGPKATASATPEELQATMQSQANLTKAANKAEAATAEATKHIPTQTDYNADKIKAAATATKAQAEVSKLQRTKMQAQKAVNAAKSELTAKVTTDFEAKQQRLVDTISQLEKESQLPIPPQRKLEVTRGLENANKELLALQKSHENALGRIKSSQALDNITDESIAKAHTAYLDQIDKHANLATELSKAFDVADDAAAVAADARGVAQLIKNTPSNATTIERGIFDRLAPHLAGDPAGLYKHLVTGLFDGTSDLLTKPVVSGAATISPTAVVETTLNAFRRSYGDAGVQQYRRLFMQAFLNAAMNPHTQTFENGQKVLKRLSGLPENATNLGEPARIFQEILRRPNDTPQELAARTSQFFKFFNETFAEAPGLRSSSWMMPLRQWVVFDLSHHIMGVPAAAALAGGFSLLKAYRLPDLLALVAENPKQWIDFTARANKIGPGRALMNNVALRTALDTIPSKTINAPEGVWDKYRSTISSPKSTTSRYTRAEWEEEGKKSSQLQ